MGRKLLVAFTLALGCHAPAATPTAPAVAAATPAAAPQRSGLMPVACHDVAPAAAPASESGTCSLEEETP